MKSATTHKPAHWITATGNSSGRLVGHNGLTLHPIPCAPPALHSCGIVFARCPQNRLHALLYHSPGGDLPSRYLVPQGGITPLTSVLLHAEIQMFRTLSRVIPHDCNGKIMGMQGIVDEWLSGATLPTSFSEDAALLKNSLSSLSHTLSPLQWALAKEAGDVGCCGNAVAKAVSTVLAPKMIPGSKYSPSPDTGVMAFVPPFDILLKAHTILDGFKTCLPSIRQPQVRCFIRDNHSSCSLALSLSSPHCQRFPWASFWQEGLFAPQVAAWLTCLSVWGVSVMASAEEVSFECTLAPLPSDGEATPESTVALLAAHILGQIPPLSLHQLHPDHTEIARCCQLSPFDYLAAPTL